MQEHKRRKTNYRLSERKHDFSSLLNRMIVDNNQFSIRESLNPMAEEHIFPLMNSDRSLSNEALTTLLKLTEKEVLIVGFILPKILLVKCWEILTGVKQTNFTQKNINCAVLNKNMLANTNTLIIMIDQNDINLERRLEISQKIIINLSFVLVTTIRVAQKRLQQWELEQNLFDKHAGLMIIKEEGSQFNDNMVQNIQAHFWVFDAIHTNQLQNRYRGIKQNTLTVPQRNAYQPMNEEEQEGNGFASRLNALALISLKRNWKISKGLLCYPFLYLVNIWLNDEQRDPRQLLENAMISYCKNSEEQFRKFLENFKLPLDQLKLRNSIQTQKKTLLISARKHLTMFENIFPAFQLTSKSYEGLNRFFCEAAKDTYVLNNNLANQSNITLLEKLYQQIIDKKFGSSKSNIAIQEFQSDFQKLLQVYGSQSFRVSSQLKTFNDFFIQKKYQYAQNLGRLMQNGKKKYYSQKQELKDRLDIQTGALQTLETQLRQLQEKRKKIDLENSLLKVKISDYCKKKPIENGSENNQTSRKKYFQIDRRTKLQTKVLNSKKQPVNKGCKCCCQIM